jgi:hypothetical protein
LLSKFTVQDLVNNFNSSGESVRVLAIVSPSCKDCIFGFEAIKKLFERYSSSKLRGIIIWTAMLQGDNEKTAKTMSEGIQDERIEQYWDYERVAGRLFAKTLRLQNGTAWDVYLLYSPRMKWESEERAPEPAFWMHQLDSDRSADPKLRLDARRLEQETRFLLEAEEPDPADGEIAQKLIDKEKHTSSFSSK